MSCLLPSLLFWSSALGIASEGGSETAVSSYPRGMAAGTRSIWSILWGCITIVFACTWVSIHPNIPALEDSQFTIFRRRLWLMFVALLAPELVLLWAMRQCTAARQISQDIGEKGTMRQGFFFLMGGYVDKSRRPIDPTNYPRELLERIQIDNEDIADRSKSDFLAKGIVLSQVLWFVSQCIARLTIAGLAPTELEVATLAFAALNTVSYILWLKKPLDVQRPVRVQFETEDSQDTESSGPPYYHFLENGTPTKKIPIFLKSVMKLVSVIGEPTYCSQIPPGAMRVPTFYAPAIKHNQMILSNLVAAATGTVFGAIHFLAWELDFPSALESKLWRIGTIVTVVYPGVLFGYFWMISIGGRDMFDHPSVSIPRFVIDVSIILGLLVYIASRFVLVALACTTLRKLPQGSEWDIDWGMHIPHF